MHGYHRQGHQTADDYILPSQVNPLGRSSSQLGGMTRILDDPDMELQADDGHSGNNSLYFMKGGSPSIERAKATAATTADTSEGNQPTKEKKKKNSIAKKLLNLTGIGKKKKKTEMTMNLQQLQSVQTDPIEMRRREMEIIQRRNSLSYTGVAHQHQQAEQRYSSSQGGTSGGGVILGNGSYYDQEFGRHVYAVEEDDDDDDDADEEEGGEKKKKGSHESIETTLDSFMNSF